jgi:oxygen-independent coproporphyrinogen-3 oxidase
MVAKHRNRFVVLIPHISSYALTVEPKTALHSFIQKGKFLQPKDEVAQEHFHDFG